MLKKILFFFTSVFLDSCRGQDLNKRAILPSFDAVTPEHAKEVHSCLYHLRSRIFQLHLQLKEEGDEK